MATKVQMRGGTSEEHSVFTGLNREVTVDTTKKTLVIHDGVTVGGFPLLTNYEFQDYSRAVDERIDGILDDIGDSHNHDDDYAKLVHTHSEYVEKVSGTKPLTSVFTNGYEGIATNGNNTADYIRTPESGLLPFKSGGYSNIGSSTWRFANGFFNNLDSKNVTVDGGELKLKNSSKIQFNNDDTLSYNDTTNEYQLTADGDVNKARLCLGHIELGGRRIYIGSSFPSDARVNDILIQI